ncbi:uncharacterized protein LOC124813992 [Hydra vulgaris]|uniref:uncharacterized protein LOC124813992 n=1 Tax=Hydra vulgaris TaxID=6087 RepID=UPI0032E9C1F5
MANLLLTILRCFILIIQLFFLSLVQSAQTTVVSTSCVTPATLKEETASARLHNIDSEELMGVFSDAKGRCPNATICFISSKLRSKKNRTIDYLDNLEESSREKVVKWSIYMAQKKRIITRLKCHEIRSEITNKLSFKRQKMDEKQKKKLERELSILSLGEMMHKYKHLSAKQLKDLDDVMSERIVGRTLDHEWYDADFAKSVIYDGRVEKVNKRLQDRIFTISYWKQDETDIKAVEHKMKKIQLAADVISGWWVKYEHLNEKMYTRATCNLVKQFCIELFFFNNCM